MNVLRNRLGFALRETGQALERLGCRAQGIDSYLEEGECAARTPACALLLLEQPDADADARAHSPLAAAQ
jgi:hypothetical protein